MSIKAILFDLDGTLVPMDQDVFVKDYFKRLSTKLAGHGYEPKQLIDTIWKGTAAMIRNNSELTNEQVFWNMAQGVYGDKIIADKYLFDEFYETEFDKVKSVCGYNPKAKETVLAIKQMGYKLALATNPIFPPEATELRIAWAGLTPNDFEFYTNYTNINCCKPNPAYYKEVARRIGCDLTECLMVGNDIGDDMVAEKLGMRVFLLTECLINAKGEDISHYPQGDFDDLIDYIKSFR
ncbi:MAG: HAD family hydrolase [Clostridia bacterium]|nr:HAD family hydrolase [Clostridia bacterium]